MDALIISKEINNKKKNTQNYTFYFLAGAFFLGPAFFGAAFLFGAGFFLGAFFAIIAYFSFKFVELIKF